jgi:hypothetical protein
MSHLHLDGSSATPFGPGGNREQTSGPFEAAFERHSRIGELAEMWNRGGKPCACWSRTSTCDQGPPRTQESPDGLLRSGIHTLTIRATPSNMTRTGTGATGSAATAT